MKFLLVLFSCIFKLLFDVIELLNFPQIGVDKGSHGRKIDFSEQVSGCCFIFCPCVYFSVNFEALITSGGEISICICNFACN